MTDLQDLQKALLELEKQTALLSNKFVLGDDVETQLSTTRDAYKAVYDLDPENDDAIMFNALVIMAKIRT